LENIRSERGVRDRAGHEEIRMGRSGKVKKVRGRWIDTVKRQIGRQELRVRQEYNREI
jgi:hypothetical protein